MFQKILIANRGEIACRIMRTAKRLGIKTVAVYSEADAAALHVKQADEAYLIGPAPSQESYLNAAKIIQVAQQTGAEAIHPGYGFLSENAEFAEKCAQSNLIFIGPPAQAIRLMGEKSTAKELMETAKVPIIPGYLGEHQDLKSLQKEADIIGYPLLIKAIAGGGGKGMRVVKDSKQFADALVSAKREAKASFGDDRVLLEKYLQNPRHIEVQVFADSQGHALYLYERDCSIQRRHQKIIEEAPAPHLSDELRKSLGQAAIKAVQAIAYQGAGTIEFLLDQDQRFYFMEMNTRLQVEHPVTEMITGYDLVEWQLQVAVGEALPVSQHDIKHTGHAIEARIYAEDPYKDFMPSIGHLVHLKTPQENQHVRIDSGVTQGDSISPYYDPMIAKLIVWDQDRTTALMQLREALADYQIVGVTTNLPLLLAVINHPDFIQEKISTHFIEQYPQLLLKMKPASSQVQAIAGLALMLLQNQEAEAYASTSDDAQSPWFARNAWQLNSAPIQVIRFWDQEKLVDLSITHGDTVYELAIDQDHFQMNGYLDEQGHLTATLDNQNIQADIVRVDQRLHLFLQGQTYIFNLAPSRNANIQTDAASHLIAPMPGTIVNISINAGQKVNKGDSLLVIEAMKMEHTLYAPADGVVKEVLYKVGDLIQEGVELLKFKIIP